MVLTRWYIAPPHPVAVKGAVVRRYHGSGPALIRVTASERLLRLIEVQYQLVRRPAPDGD